MTTRLKHGRPATAAEIKQQDTPRGSAHNADTPWPIVISPCAFPIDCGMGLQHPAVEVRPEEDYQELLQAAEQVIDSVPDGPSLDVPDVVVALAGLKGTIRELEVKR